MSTISDQKSEEPLESFAGCHVGIISMVRELAGLPDLIRPARRFQAITLRLEDFFNQVVKTHHSEEEAQLFTAVLASASSVSEKAEIQKLISKLTDEHRVIERTFMSLLPKIKAVTKNLESDLDEKEINLLVDLYLSHAHFEEEVFLPLAKIILNRNGNHMAALGLSIHMRHSAEETRQKFGAI